MTETLEAAWRAGRPPFAGSTLFTPDDVEWPIFADASRIILGHLQDAFPGEPLLRCDDWHCHDGFGTAPERTDWGFLEKALTSPDALRRIASSDWGVYCAVYPESHRFLWRMCLRAPEDWPSFDRPVVQFDVSADAEEIGTLRKTLAGISGGCFEVENAKEHFDSIYGG